MDLIDRGALRKELAYMWYDNMNATAEDVEKRIFDAPTVEAVRHGKWIFNKEKRTWECLECHYQTDSIFDKSKTNYCPNCGAKMED